MCNRRKLNSTAKGEEGDHKEPQRNIPEHKTGRCAMGRNGGGKGGDKRGRREPPVHGPPGLFRSLQERLRASRSLLSVSGMQGGGLGGGYLVQPPRRLSLRPRQISAMKGQNYMILSACNLSSRAQLPIWIKVKETSRNNHLSA